jgi:hypothetical protein
MGRKVKRLDARFGIETKLEDRLICNSPTGKAGRPWSREVGAFIVFPEFRVLYSGSKVRRVEID